MLLKDRPDLTDVKYASLRRLTEKASGLMRSATTVELHYFGVGQAIQHTLWINGALSQPPSFEDAVGLQKVVLHGLFYNIYRFSRQIKRFKSFLANF
ncbi:hypothetical protein LLH06_14335 [Mucilaginibacter daejeonensis]|uniref:hypothetical protein n=1 Tax=Mucilaginibacter daejeonensis TaxID=398049 RepID=UPI001D1768F7|nr:hypothetical protein [Mucilaginibacter daejeonensis]UEG52141.1 hypothetical protein LLH06_14335 [Mucilaginibacter daejeonensis]